MSPERWQQIQELFYACVDLETGPRLALLESSCANDPELRKQVQDLLQASGMTMDDLVSVQVYTPDIANYDAFNKAYRTFFKQEFPARAFLGSGTLLNGAKFEILGIAVKR